MRFRATKKLVAIIIFSYFIIAAPNTSAAYVTTKAYQEDSVSENMWDWLTTLGKSPEAKREIKNEHRRERARERAAHKRKAQLKAQEKLNSAREKEAQAMDEARLRAKRKRIEDKRRKVMRP